MKRLSVDLRSRSSPPTWAWWLAGISVASGATLGIVALDASRKVDALKAQHEALVRRLATPQAPPLVVERKMPYDASAREMLALAHSEWPAMLTALESVEVAGVTLVALDVAPADRRVQVEVEFIDYAALLSFLEQLNAGEPVRRWALVQAQSSSRTRVGSEADLSKAAVRAAW